MNPRLKLLTLVALGLALAAPAIRADEPPAPPPPNAAPDQPPPPAAPGDRQHDRMAKMRKHRMKELDAALHLTADEKTKIEAIWDNAEQQGKAIWMDDSLSPQEKRAKMAAVMKSSRDQVRAVLTPDQQKIYDTLPPERMGRPGRRPQGGGSDDAPPPPPPPAGGGQQN